MSKVGIPLSAHRIIESGAALHEAQGAAGMHANQFKFHIIMKHFSFALASLLLIAAGACTKTGEPEPVKVEGISLESETLALLPSSTHSLVLTIEPENAEYGDVQWSSDNEGVATVDQSGNVTAVAPGSANITASVDEFETSCAVTVFSGNKLADEAQVGDFYLSDGSLLDKDTDEGTVKTSSVIGIVFSTDTDRMGEAEKEALREKGIEPHGLVLATLTPGTKDDFYSWFMMEDYTYTRDESELGLPKLWDNFEEGEGKQKETFALVDSDIEGYKYNVAIRTQRKEDFDAGYYGAMKAAADFENQVPSPAISTGWYLPSGGQWFDVLRNLAGITLNDSDSFLLDDYGNFSWVNKGRVNDILNEKIAKVADDQKLPFASLGNQDQYWTSSTVSDTQARVIMFDNATFVYSWWYNKFYQWSVRTVLGF